MTAVLQLRRGTSAETASFTGAAGEITYDTTDKRPVMHDGSTAGGIPVARESELPNQAVNTTSNPQFATIELGAASDTTLSRSAAGVLAVEGVDLTGEIRQNSQSTAYTCVLADANKHILHPAADNNARTFTIPANGSVAYPIGTTLTFINEINTVTISITTDTLTLSSAGTTGSRTLAANGMATAIKITSTKWMISGTGLT